MRIHRLAVVGSFCLALAGALAFGDGADEKQAKDVMVHADARSYLLTRPYVKQLVRIEVNDPADPHPAWLVSTRHPRRLAAVAEQVRG